MGIETPTVQVEIREKTGTRYARRLRESGRLPAVIYGKGKDPMHVSVDQRTMLDVLHGGAHVLEVNVDDQGADTCLVKDLQFGWLGDNLIHVDFTRVDLDETVTVNVPVTLVGIAKAASATGALLEVIRREIEVTCRVADIPSDLKYDITDVEEAVTIGDLTFPAGVVPVLPFDKHICHITLVLQEEAEGEETEAAADSSEPEVIIKPKEESEEDSKD